MKIGDYSQNVKVFDGLWGVDPDYWNAVRQTDVTIPHADDVALLAGQELLIYDGIVPGRPYAPGVNPWVVGGSYDWLERQRVIYSPIARAATADDIEANITAGYGALQVS